MKGRVKTNYRGVFSIWRFNLLKTTYIFILLFPFLFSCSTSHNGQNSDVINPTQYIYHEDTETCTPVYTKYDENYEMFYSNALKDIENAKNTREYMLDMANHPNWFDASFIPWISYDSLNIELPDGHLFFAPIINWGKYREENNRFVMPVSVRLNHAVADGYLVAKVFRLLEHEIKSFVK